MWIVLRKIGENFGISVYETYSGTVWFFYNAAIEEVEHAEIEQRPFLFIFKLTDPDKQPYHL